MDIEHWQLVAFAILALFIAQLFGDKARDYTMIGLNMIVFLFLAGFFLVAIFIISWDFIKSLFGMA